MTTTLVAKTPTLVAMTTFVAMRTSLVIMTITLVTMKTTLIADVGERLVPNLKTAGYGHYYHVTGQHYTHDPSLTRNIVMKVMLLSEFSILFQVLS